MNNNVGTHPGASASSEVCGYAESYSCYNLHSRTSGRTFPFTIPYIGYDLTVYIAQTRHIKRRNLKKKTRFRLVM